MRPIDHLRNEMRDDHPAHVIATAVDGLTADAENQAASFPSDPSVDGSLSAGGLSFQSILASGGERPEAKAPPLVLLGQGRFFQTYTPCAWSPRQRHLAWVVLVIVGAFVVLFCFALFYTGRIK